MTRNQAWKLPDGRYRLIFGESPFLYLTRPEHGGSLEYLEGEWYAEHGEWIVPGSALEILQAEKVYGVVTGPSSCGCEPAMFRWVGASEVEAGQTNRKTCHTCAFNGTQPLMPLATYRCDILDVCGEPDVAVAVYEAEFASHIGALT